jgi:hypothetical protein
MPEVNVDSADVVAMMAFPRYLVAMIENTALNYHQCAIPALKSIDLDSCESPPRRREPVPLSLIDGCG